MGGKEGSRGSRGEEMTRKGEDKVSTNRHTSRLQSAPAVSERKGPNNHITGDGPARKKSFHCKGKERQARELRGRLVRESLY